MTKSLKEISPTKVKISKSDERLDVDVQGNVELLDDNHALTFFMWGFEDNHSGNGYFMITKNHDKKIKDVMDYLKKYGYEVITDKETANTINNMQTREETLETSKRIGKQIKKQKKIIKINPKHFARNIKIKPYQFKPIQHMVDVGNAANFSVPGSGKTLMTYAVYDILKSKRIVDVLFVVGPISSFVPWQDEYQFCFNVNAENNVLRYLGSSRFKQLKNFGKYDVILTTYGTATNDRDHLIRDLMKTKKVMMVIDESHHIKRFSEKASFANAMIELGKGAKSRYILSGTPMPRDFADLWSQITFLWPNSDILGSRTTYKRILERIDAASEISNRINFLWTRVRNSQLESDLPTILPHKTDFIPMSQNQEEIYRSLENNILKFKNETFFEESYSPYRRNLILRLLQASTNPGVMVYGDPDLELEPFQSVNKNLTSLIKSYKEIPPKLQKAAEIARKIVNKDQNIVIWTVFIKNVERLNHLLSDLNPISISGEIPIDSDNEKDVVGREERINYFKTHKGNVLIATMGSIAESVSLHKACRYAVYLERSFNAGQYMQSLSRIYRIGSDKKKPIQFHLLQSVFRDGRTETIDGRIDIVLKDRIEKLHRLLDDKFKLHPLSLETSSYKMSGQKSSVEDEETNTIFKEIRDMVEDHKKKQKI